MAETLSGRLVTDGTGRLFIQPTSDDNEVINAIHLVDEDGMPTEELVAGIVEVAWDEASGGYIAVGPGEESHNERHHKGEMQEISGTTGDLYDAEGNLVIAGDPHHFEPLPTDPHYDPTSPTKITMQTIPDEISAQATSHTEAYT